MKESTQRICALADDMAGRLAACRRSFHSYPETAWLEMRTSAIIAHRLKELGWEVLTGSAAVDPEARRGVPAPDRLAAHAREVLTQPDTPADSLTEEMRQGVTGVVGILRCGEGPVLALRFDIDALGMAEATDEGHRPAREGFASRNPGMMHACGHDGHAAIGLGVAEVLMAVRDSLHGTVKLLFQPAEEGAKGARAMVAAGHLEDVDILIGNHIAPTDSLDDGDITAGTWGSLATVKYDVTFRGLAAHAGGYPEEGRNALLSAAAAVLSLHAIPRHSGGQTRVNVGRLEAGTGRNVVPDEARMELEVRGETTEINAFMARRAEEICRGAAQMQGCGVTLTVVGEAESQHSDLPLIARIGEVVRRDMPSYTLSTEQNARNWGSEDISIMMNRVQAHGGQAAYMRTMTPMASAQHTVRFDFDERVLPMAVKLFSLCAAAFCGEESTCATC